MEQADVNSLPLRAALGIAPLPRRRNSSAVEQRFCKPQVGGSIPSSGTIHAHPDRVRMNDKRR
jgi:hypothetical protein